MREDGRPSTGKEGKRIKKHLSAKARGEEGDDIAWLRHGTPEVSQVA